ncbi:hypothetical protein JX266_009266 [Neoarthrinium moseri]|nr:hypothetical protein JX266_009266 [Neoarthrinium moseri]
MPQPRGFRFFDLPAELRADILEQLVLVPQDVPVHARAETSTESPPAALLDLFLACTQMYQEASAIFYARNRFLVNLGSRRMFSDITAEGQFFSPEGLDARRRVRALRLRLRRLSGDFEKVIAPIVSDMILCGSLRSLEIGILTQSSGLKANTSCRSSYGRGLEADSLVTTSPFQTLLRLLADPDLEEAGLWVAQIHWSVWCPFHETYDGNHSCLASLRREGIEQVSVDWEKIVRELGDVNIIARKR